MLLTLENGNVISNKISVIRLIGLHKGCHYNILIIREILWFTTTSDEDFMIDEIEDANG